MSLKTRIILIIIIALFVGGNLYWEHVNGGVATHYLLHDEDLPGFSNWWGLLIVPLVAGLLLWRMDVKIKKREEQEQEKARKHVILGVAGGLIVGAAISVLFTLDWSEGALAVLIGFVVFSLFRSLFQAEILLGIMLGMYMTFGGVLPLIVGGILMVVAAIANLIRKGVMHVVEKIRT